MNKKIHQNDITGLKGINLIQRVLLDMGFLWYPTGGVEAGIDGWIEIRDSETGVVLSSIIGVQSKATTLPFTAETTDSFQYLCKEDDLDYWLQGNAPVILVVSRPDANDAYWVSIKDYFRDPVRRKARKVFFNKREDRFDVNCKPALMQLAIPADSGVYFAPPRKHERLYSNLIPVTRIFATIYAANTEYRTAAELSTALKEHQEYPSNIWILKDKKLYSPHDLTEFPWREVCDPHSIESTDSHHWAYATDVDRRRDFVRLLREALREKLGRMRIGYSKLQDCYYFKASKDLSPRHYRYLSQQNQADRVVVTRYHSAKNPDLTWFRHCAFAGRFRLFDGVWYLEISPTYYFTTDGKLPWCFYEDWLSGIKRRQKNHAVLGEVIMWSRVLEDRHDLFTTPSPLLGFGQLQMFDIDVGIHDHLWLPSEQAIQAEREPDVDFAEAQGDADSADEDAVLVPRQLAMNLDGTDER